LSTFSIVLLAFGLSMDAFAVSVSCGLNDPDLLIKEASLAGITFGSFQAGMTALGWILGFTFTNFISSYSQTISLVLLSLIGIKMIYEAFAEEPKVFSLTNIMLLLSLGVATSVDAMAAGVSLASLNIGLTFPAMIIGLLTFLVSFFGVIIGCKITQIISLNRIMNILGGVILISLGIRIFIS